MTLTRKIKTMQTCAVTNKSQKFSPDFPTLVKTVVGSGSGSETIDVQLDENLLKFEDDNSGIVVNMSFRQQNGPAILHFSPSFLVPLAPIKEQSASAQLCHCSWCCLRNRYQPPVVNYVQYAFISHEGTIRFLDKSRALFKIFIQISSPAAGVLQKIIGFSCNCGFRT